MDIENYIRNNRTQLDVEQPNEEIIWNGITHSLQNQTRQKQVYYWKYAVMAAAMIVIAFMVGYFVTQKNEYHLVFVNIDPELAKQEVELVNKIETYTKQIKQVNFNTETLPTTPAELKYTDKLIEAYSEDLRQYGSNPELIQTLLDLYEKKIILLKRMLSEIEKEKEYENDKVFL